MRLLLLLFCGCQAHGCDQIPETITALQWHNLRGSPDFFRCLYGLRSQGQLLHALYFATGRPKEVLVEGAERLGAVWLNADVDEHLILYSFGQRQQLVQLVGMELTSEHFEDVELCNENLSSSCSALEVAPEDLACLEGRCKARLATLVLQLHANQTAVDPEAEHMAYCSPALPAELVGHEAQCLLSRCVLQETKLDYMGLVACRLGGDVGKSVLALMGLLAYFFLVIGVVADSYLVPALCQIGRHLQLSDAMLGATLLALGGSITDLMTGLVSVLAGDANSQPDVSLWLGGLVGAGLFATTFVASLVPLTAETQMDAAAFTRDLGFRSLANGLIILAAISGAVPALYSIMMIGCYGLYVIATLRDPKLEEAQEAPETSVSSFTRHSVSFLAHSGSICLPAPAQVESEHCSARLKRLLGVPESGVMEWLNFAAALPLRPFFCLTMATASWDRTVNVLLPLGLCLFLPFGNPLGNSYAYPERNMMSLLVVALVGLALSVHVGLLARRRPNSYIGFIYYQWATFLSSLLWIGLIASEIVGVLTVLGRIIKLSPTTMGLTLLALGNSIDNVFSTLGLVSNGQATVAITGIYAADAFTMLCVCGSILLLLSLKQKKAVPIAFTPTAHVLLLTIQVVLAATWFCTWRNAWRMPRLLGKLLMACYPAALAAGFLLEAALK